MEPGEKAFGTRCTRASIAFRAAVGLLFAAPRTPGEDQWREWRGKRRERAIGLERQPGFDSCLHVQWIDPTSQSIGAGRNLGESLLDRELSGLDRLDIVAGCDPDGVTYHDGKGGEGKIDGEATPGGESQKSPRGDGKRHDWAARQGSERGNAFACPARGARRYVGGHGHRRAACQRPQRFAQGSGAAAIALSPA